MPRFVPRALRGQVQRGPAQRARGTEARHLTTKPAPERTKDDAEELVTVPAVEETAHRRPSPRPRPKPSPGPKAATAVVADSVDATDTAGTEQDDPPATRRAPLVKAPARPGGKTATKSTKSGKNGKARGGRDARRGDRRPTGRRKAQARRTALRLAKLHRWVRVLAVAVVVVGLGALALAGLSGMVKLPLVSGQLSDSARNDALASANAAAPAVLSYDYRSFDASIAKAKPFLTGSFAKQYASTTEGLRANAVKEHAVVSAQVSASGVVTASPTAVDVLLYVNQYRQNSNITGQKVDENRVVMTMVPVGDQWKVSKVTAI